MIKLICCITSIAILGGTCIAVGEAKSEKVFLVEIVVVFKKTVSEERAKAILVKFNQPHRSGMDSSRGKRYFYETGPKFIMHVPGDRREDFKKKLREMPEIYEVYDPDWNIHKD